MTKIPVSISQLAKYGLDYVSLISSSGLRSRPVKTEPINSELIPISDLIFKSEADNISLKLITTLNGFDQNLADAEKSDEQREAEKRIEYHKNILNKIQEIDTKIRTDEYTKRVVLQTGFISFEGKKVLESDFNDEYIKYEAPLFQLSISNIDFKFTPDGAIVNIELPSSSIEVLSGPLKAYLPQQYYDTIFSFVADAEAEEKTSLPLTDEFVTELWSTIKVQLDRVDAKSISESPYFNTSIIGITNKTNHFLAEDLRAIANLEDDELLETSLGSWVSDEDMTIEQEVSDCGSTEIFFPFDYDKYQLKVLGITNNKAIIVEGPPGTGKSQTISNLLVHLAATGKRVLFASQKDQAIRGVKDKLKTLDIPFLFGYIPDKTSKLYTEKDEKDSAANTLLALNCEFQKGKVGNLKEPLSLLADRKKIFTDNIENERSIFSLYEDLRNLSYLDQFSSYNITRDRYGKVKELEESISNLESDIKDFEAKNDKLVKAASKKFEGLDLDYQDVLDSISAIESYFKDNMPERSGWLGGKVNDIKLRNALKAKGRNLLQEVYLETEKIIFSDATKSARLQMLDKLTDYFVYDSGVTALSEKRKELDESFSSIGISATVFTQLKKIISDRSMDVVFADFDRYNDISNKIDNLELYSSNELNKEIKDIRKFYRTNTTNYVRNRILTRIDEANNCKNTKAILAQVARDLSKSKKANKTFDRLKHNPEKFEAMKKVLPIWMMSLDDVSRIIPTERNAFDYVIIDEASQCNFAYAFPTMFRAKHTIFFGDTLQMRDDNTMFKSNDQLSATARKYKIPDKFQIKAEEDAVKSVMDIANLNGFKTATLKYHYRSPSELIGFSNKSFYEPIGRKLEAVNDNIVPYKDTGRILLTHIVTPNNDEEVSDKTNLAEVRKVQELINDIKNDPILKDKSIGVLTFFNEQAELIRGAIKDDDIKVSIIDGIQGDERDIIIYSFVIKDPSDKKRYVALTGEGGEIRKDIAAGRVNVAFSRAKLQAHCITSLEPSLWPEGIWIKKYLEYVDKYGVVARRHSKDGQQFDSNFEEQAFNFLSKNLDANVYTLETQAKSLGFKIDLAVYRDGHKLALEFDGPTHFEGGDGQVYVKEDWDRQYILETAGWSFYRVSYFDWVKDQCEEEKAMLDYIKQFFDGSNLNNKSSIVKELEKETVKPEDAPKETYITNFSDELVDHTTHIKTSNSNPTRAKSTTSTKKPTFSVGDREVNQDILETYLRNKTPGRIEIRYQSMRAGSSRYWRTINVSSYDNTYINAIQSDRDYPIKYRRDRVIEFR